jgi:hypothetical protein
MKTLLQSSSNIIINWFSSLNASQSEINTYYPIVQRTVIDACPVLFCSLDFASIRVLGINWKNLQYQLPGSTQSIVSFILKYFFFICYYLIFSQTISFSAYLINTYETSSLYSYPVLRSYLSFDYTDLPSNLGGLRPFAGM